MTEDIERETSSRDFLASEDDDETSTATTACSSMSGSADDDDDKISRNQEAEDDCNDETRTVQSNVFLRPLQQQQQQQSPRKIILIDARAHSLTVAWPFIPGTKYYRVETTCLGDDNFRAVSKVRQNIHQTTITRLLPQHQYLVWITPISLDGRESLKLVPQTPFSTLSKDQDRKCLPMPKTCLDKKRNELTVHWRLHFLAQPSPRYYDLQVRAVGDTCDGWRTIGVCLGRTHYTLKGVSPNENCQFRVKTSTQRFYSPPSRPTMNESRFQSMLHRIATASPTDNVAFSVL